MTKFYKKIRKIGSIIKKGILSIGKSVIQKYGSRIADQTIRSLPVSDKFKKALMGTKQLLTNVQINSLNQISKDFNIQRARQLFKRGFDSDVKLSQRKQILKDVARDVLEKVVVQGKIISPQLLNLDQVQKQSIPQPQLVNNDAVMLAKLAK